MKSKHMCPRIKTYSQIDLLAVEMFCYGAARFLGATSAIARRQWLHVGIHDRACLSGCAGAAIYGGTNEIMKEVISRVIGLGGRI